MQIHSYGCVVIDVCLFSLCTFFLVFSKITVYTETTLESNSESLCSCFSLQGNTCTSKAVSSFTPPPPPPPQPNWPLGRYGRGGGRRGGGGEEDVCCPTGLSSVMHWLYSDWRSHSPLRWREAINQMAKKLAWYSKVEVSHFVTFARRPPLFQISVSTPEYDRVYGATLNPTPSFMCKECSYQRLQNAHLQQKCDI